MWLPPALLLLSLPGCFSRQGSESVSGWERGSLTVPCRYGHGWGNYVKYWCRGAAWSSCRILVSTTGTEQEAREGRLSIRDHQGDRVFTVTMEALRLGDTDTYWCGIERVGADLGDKVQVTVFPEGTDLNPPTSNHTAVASGPHARTRHVLLVFVKVPILLLAVGAVLWWKQAAGSPSLQACPLAV
ncbi:PREDICTED: CMRF35-like molecule 7 [Condylura cristata]|uniref:CMRF35-like molecule 7 n=1 Tax=Condylura cristata TaxID=143302 RepID=UPI000334450E|nr:PREDICTED: CMRF35-like molecule 7 [Condylura cristata]